MYGNLLKALSSSIQTTLSRATNNLVRDGFREDEKIATGKYEFDRSLTEFVVPTTCAYIGRSAFLSSSLRKIYIPDSVVAMGKGVFMDCHLLSEVRLSESIRELPDLAFISCSSLTSVRIPNSVMWIGTQCFMHCSKLSNVTMTENLAEIGSEVFSDCGSLEKVRMPSTLPCIPGDVAKDSNTIVHIDESTVIIYDPIVPRIESRFVQEKRARKPGHEMSYRHYPDV